MQSEQLIHQLQQLKLAGMVQALQEQQGKSMNTELTFEERLGLLVNRELTSRDNRKVQNLLCQAKLRQQACVEDVQYEAARQLNKSQFLSLASADFILGKPY